MGDRAEDGELLAEVRATGAPAEIRGTMLVASRRAADERGLGDAYEAHLPPEHRETLRGINALAWYPMALAEVHYAALDALIPEEADQLGIGRQVAARVQGRFLATLLRAMAVTGMVTPHRAFTLAPKLIGRNLRGVSVAAYRTGVDSALVRVEGLEILRHAFCRHTLRGWLEHGIESIAARAETRVEVRADDAVALRVSWRPFGHDGRRVTTTL